MMPSALRKLEQVDARAGLDRGAMERRRVHAAEVELHAASEVATRAARVRMPAATHRHLVAAEPGKEDCTLYVELGLAIDEHGGAKGFVSLLVRAEVLRILFHACVIVPIICLNP